MHVIVFEGERETVDAGAAVVVVIERALVIVLMLIAGGRGIFVIAAARFLNVGASGVVRLGGGEDTRVQPGENAENQKPCEKVPHRWLSMIQRDEVFKGIRCFNFLAVASDRD